MGKKKHGAVMSVTPTDCPRPSGAAWHHKAGFPSRSRESSSSSSWGRGAEGKERQTRKERALILAAACSPVV